MILVPYWFSYVVRPPLPLIDWLSSHLSNRHKTQQINLLPLFIIFSQSTSSPRSSSVLHGWRIDDDDALERSGWLEEPIAAARPDRVPLGRVRFRVSRDLAGVSCVSRSRRGSSSDMSCVSRSSLKAQSPVWTSPRRQPIPKSARPYIERSSSLSSVWPN